MDYDAILNEAHAAARAAVAAEVAARPERETDFDCGFAWVTVDGNSAIARHCRAKLKAGSDHATRHVYGDKGAVRGWQWWKPGGFGGQSIRIHRKGSEAFVAKLGEYGIRADMGSRLD